MSDYLTLFNDVKLENGLLCEFEPAPAGSLCAIGTCTLYGNRLSLYNVKSGTILYRFIAANGRDADAESGRTGTKDVAEAFIFANHFLIRIATEHLRHGIVASAPVSLRQDEVTLGDAYNYIRANLRSDYKEKSWRELLRVMLLTSQLWSADRAYTSLSQLDAALYLAVRTEQGISLPAEFSKRPNLKPCKLATAVADLQVLGAAFRKLKETAIDEKTQQKLFASNPFDSISLPDVDKALREKPKPERYDVLMQFVDVIDPTGQLRLALVFARWLGRRIGAISALRRDHLRLTTQEMSLTIREIAKRGHNVRDGIQSSDFAFEFKQGAIFFDRDWDKEGYQRLVPISSLIREEIELYLTRNPNLKPEGPLFPAEGDPAQSTHVVEFIERLLAAEELARQAGHEREVPRLYNSVFHGFRGLRASELESKQHRASHVNFVVGWTCKTGKSKEDRYVTHDPRLLYAAVEGLKPVEIEQEYKQAVADTEAENERLREQNERLATQVTSMEEQNAKLAQQMERMAKQIEQFFSRFPSE